MIFKETEDHHYEEIKLLEGQNFGDKTYEMFMNSKISIIKLPSQEREKYLSKGTPVCYFAFPSDSKTLTLVNLKNFKSNKIDRFWRWDSRFRKKKVIPISLHLVLKESISAKKNKKKMKQTLHNVFGLCLISGKFFAITRLIFAKQGVEQSWYCYNDYFPNGN